MKQVKSSQIYGWDEEPVDERPSEFNSTTGHSVLSGYHSANESPRERHRRPSGRIGFKAMLMFCAVLLTLGGYALARLAPLLRG